MQTRGFVAAEYRFGFNGKEKEADYTTDNYDFGARLYDGRLGRWFAVDPSFRLIPDNSTFKGFKNNPIIYIDPDGRKEILKIVMEDFNGQRIIFTKQISMNIMTDGIKHEVHGWTLFGSPTATWSYENKYYDYERVITLKMNKDGTINTTESLNILTSGPIRDKDDVWFSGANYGESKFDWNEYMTTGNTQRGGFHLTSVEGGVSPTTTTATKGRVIMIDIGPFLTALGGLGGTPRQPSKIKEALGPAEFLNNIGELKQKAHSEIDKWEKSNATKTFRCTNPGCTYETADSANSAKQHPQHNLQRIPQ
jgi:RHS repeat-associated protein